jgi:hypothetical protein
MLTPPLKIPTQALFWADSQTLAKLASVLVRKLTVQARKSTVPTRKFCRTSTEIDRTYTEVDRTSTEIDRTYTEVLSHKHESQSSNIPGAYRVIHIFSRGMYVFIYMYIYYYIPSALNLKKGGFK